MKRFSILLIMIEMQIKTATRLLPCACKNVYYQKTRDNKHWLGYGEKNTQENPNSW